MAWYYCLVANAKLVDHMHDSLIMLLLICMFCTATEDWIESEPPLNHQFFTSTPKSSKEDSRRNERGWGFIRGLMDLFRFVFLQSELIHSSFHGRNIFQLLTYTFELTFSLFNAD